MILVAGSRPRRRSVCPFTGRIGSRFASRRADQAPAARTTRSACEARPVGELDAGRCQSDHVGVRAQVVDPLHELAGHAARIDLCVLVEQQPADAVGCDSRLERSAGRAVEPARADLLLVEGEYERAAARIADIAELFGKRRPELRRAARERGEAGRLRIGREHSRRGPRRAATGLAALEHADAEAALLGAPRGREADHPSADDHRIEPFHGADDRLRRRGRHPTSRAARALPALFRARGAPARRGSVAAARRGAPRRRRHRAAPRQGALRRRARPGGGAVSTGLHRAWRAVRPERPAGARRALPRRRRPRRAERCVARGCTEARRSRPPCRPLRGDAGRSCAATRTTSASGLSTARRRSRSRGPAGSHSFARRGTRCACRGSRSAASTGERRGARGRRRCRCGGRARDSRRRQTRKRPRGRCAQLLPPTDAVVATGDKEIRLPQIDWLEWSLAPGETGARPHTHAAHTDVFFVLAGEIEVRLGDETVRLPAGSCVAAPPLLLHGVSQSGRDRGALPEPARAGRLGERPAPPRARRARHIRRRPCVRDRARHRQRPGRRRPPAQGASPRAREGAAAGSRRARVLRRRRVRRRAATRAPAACGLLPRARGRARADG